ncbi:hypothetical protein WG907_04515 [Sphingobium sp. AN558]|uniref:hypothetical protein n=1 Tax=Sphingobium sp. AN558 TaxID=3133442 RepID=UPI0030C37097
MTHNKAIAAELVRIKALFQQRAILAAMGVNPYAIDRCKACNGPLTCGCPDMLAGGVAHPDDAGGR